MYKVSLRKYRSTWHWFTENPQGGGFGSNHSGSKKVALARALRGVPAGATVEITTKHEETVVSTVTITAPGT